VDRIARRCNRPLACGARRLGERRRGGPSAGVGLFLADYATLQRFARAVAALASGAADEAVLESDVTFA
jgi:hypothetical protein